MYFNILSLKLSKYVTMRKLHKIDNQIYQNDQNSIFVLESFLQWNENKIQTNLELKIKHPK